MKALARRPVSGDLDITRYERIGVILACLSVGFVLFGLSSVFLVLLGVGVAEIFVRGVVRGYRLQPDRPRALRPAGAASPPIPDAPPAGGLRQRNVFWFSGLLLAVLARLLAPALPLTIFELALAMLVVSAGAAGLSAVVGPALRRALRGRDESLALDAAGEAAAKASR